MALPFRCYIKKVLIVCKHFFQLPVINLQLSVCNYQMDLAINYQPLTNLQFATYS